MLSTGTDDEQTLVNTLETKLPNAHSRSLRCFQRVLTLYGTSGMQREFVKEVFGKVDGDGFYRAGLLDAQSPEEFDAKLESLHEEQKNRVDHTEKVFK